MKNPPIFMHAYLGKTFKGSTKAMGIYRDEIFWSSEAPSWIQDHCVSAYYTYYGNKLGITRKDTVRGVATIRLYTAFFNRGGREILNYYVKLHQYYYM